MDFVVRSRYLRQGRVITSHSNYLSLPEIPASCNKVLIWTMWCLVLLRLRHQSLGLSALQWRHNGRDSVSNHQPLDCLLNRLFRRRSKKPSKLCVTGLCAGNSPGTGEFPTQMVSNAENFSIWWRHRGLLGEYVKMLRHATKRGEGGVGWF